MAPLTSHHTLPPFPEDIETAPLVSVKFSKLEAGDAEESDALFKACKELGFFYLDLFGSELGETIVAEAERLNALQKQIFALPNEEKDRYGRPVVHPFFAYRTDDLAVRDENGVPLRKESWNIRKDDILGQCERLACHPLILENNELFKSYTLHCRAVIDLVLEQLNTQLRLPAGTLANLHRVHARSGDHIRLTRSAPGPFDAARASKAEHTDYGSLTLLCNWLGGLQIRMPDTEEKKKKKTWVYVRPVAGSCIVNVGDALVVFTAGILRSNIHRVVPPVGAQAAMHRTSLVFFTRPEDDVEIKRIRGGIIDDEPVLDNAEPGMTSHEWVMARGMGKLPAIYNKNGYEFKGNGEAHEVGPAHVAITA